MGMENEPTGLNPNVLYDLAVLGQETQAAERFWGPIPPTLGELQNYVDNTPNHHPDIEQLKNKLVEFHKNLGIFSPKVEQHLNYLSNGSILAGQQPVILGGPGFIANKLGLLAAMTRNLKDSGHQFAPVFMIGDYDGLQKELGRTYFPNPISGHATILDSEHVLDFPEETAIHTVDIPDEEWLVETLHLIDGSFRGFKKQVKDISKRKILDERWDHIQTFLRLLHFQSEKFPDFFARIWGTIANKINDYGIIFLPTSFPEIRKLYVPALYSLMTAQKQYVETFNRTYDELIKLGYAPTLPKRNHHYLPVYFECPCTDFRVSLELYYREGRPIAAGECKNCGHTVEIPLDDISHLEENASRIGLRVDSSQIAFQDLLNIKIRISGPGEIAYYSVVAPSLKKSGFKLPVFFKYKRAFYNSPWIEKLGKLLQQRKQPTLHTDKLFVLLKNRIQAIRNKDPNLWSTTEIELKKFIEAQYSGLLKYEQKLDAQKYLAWMFGRFTPHKFGQEVSWTWIDMALQTGLSDYIPTYERMYHPFSKPGLFHFINTTL